MKERTWKRDGQKDGAPDRSEFVEEKQERIKKRGLQKPSQTAHVNTNLEKLGKGVPKPQWAPLGDVMKPSPAIMGNKRCSACRKQGCRKHWKYEDGHGPVVTSLRATKGQKSRR